MSAMEEDSRDPVDPTIGVAAGLGDWEAGPGGAGCQAQLIWGR